MWKNLPWSTLCIDDAMTCRYLDPPMATSTHEASALSSSSSFTIPSCPALARGSPHEEWSLNSHLLLDLTPSRIPWILREIEIRKALALLSRNFNEKAMAGEFGVETQQARAAIVPSRHGQRLDRASWPYPRLTPNSRREAAGGDAGGRLVRWSFYWGGYRFEFRIILKLPREIFPYFTANVAMTSGIWHCRPAVIKSSYERKKKLKIDDPYLVNFLIMTPIFLRACVALLWCSLCPPNEDMYMKEFEVCSSNFILRVVDFSPSPCSAMVTQCFVNCFTSPSTKPFFLSHLLLFLTPFTWILNEVYGMLYCILVVYLSSCLRHVKLSVASFNCLCFLNSSW